jgi:hypothetical protein
MTQTDAVVNRSNSSNGSQVKVRPECWSHFDLQFNTEKGRAYLQPGQFLPIWQASGSGPSKWKCRTPFEVVAMSATVWNGRYLLQRQFADNGKTIVNSAAKFHPRIEEWDNAEHPPLAGQITQLDGSGWTRVNASNIPTLVGNIRNFDNSAINAPLFHKLWSGAEQREGNPITICCRLDSCETPPNTEKVAGVDLLRRDSPTLVQLPFPVVTSNDVDLIFQDENNETDPRFINWTSGLMEYTALYGITEIGVLHSRIPEDDVSERISTDRPKLVYRNAINQGDLGVSTLDPELYERMLPFMHGRLNVDLL